MKREIRFKAKRIDNGEWVEGGIIQWNGFAEIIKHVHMLNSIWNKENIKVDPATVCQFTGLTDKNGKDIYEGDTLYIDYNYLGTITVSFYKGRFNISNYKLEKCSITGNIHDK